MIIKKELLFTVDESNSPIEPKPRDEVHRNGYWHRTTHIWVLNNEKQIICQKRSLLKDTNPGKWSAFFGGHLAPKQDYLDGALQELKEESGIDVSKNDPHFFQIHKCISDKEFQGIYYVEWSGKIESLKLEKEEVDEVKWFGIRELIELLIEQKDNNWSLWEYQKELLEKLRYDS